MDFSHSNCFLLFVLGEQFPVDAAFHHLNNSLEMLCIIQFHVGEGRLIYTGPMNSTSDVKAPLSKNWRI